MCINLSRPLGKLSCAQLTAAARIYGTLKKDGVNDEPYIGHRSIGRKDPGIDARRLRGFGMYLDVRLGYYECLSKIGPADSTQLAKRTGTNERYALNAALGPG
jgi:hypothetical protein